MSVNIHSLIAAINPDLFCARWAERGGRRINLIAEVKQVAREQGWRAAAQRAVPRDGEPLADLSVQNPFSLSALEHPVERHEIVFDALGESLAPLYFWLLDVLPEVCPHLKQVDKLLDNFASAPGSTHFADLSRQASQMQQQAVKMLEAARRSADVLRDGLADLKTLEADLAATDPEQRTRLEGRADTLRARLKHELALARLYARWLRPYLSWAFKLESGDSKPSALVTGFNTVLLEVVLLAQDQYDVREEVAQGRLPKWMARQTRRAYVPLLIVDWRFRGVPERVREGGYIHRGRSELTLTSYALNEDELRTLKTALEQEDLTSLFRAVTGGTDETLAELERELGPIEVNRDGQRAAARSHSELGDDVNPFAALFSALWPGRRREGEPDGKGGLRPDSDFEEVLRNGALLQAQRGCRALWNLFKERQGMPVFPETEDYA